MTAPTRWQATQYATAMAQHFHARIVTKNDAVEWQMLRAALQTVPLVGQSVDHVLEHYSTTIGPFVYLADAHGADPLTKMIVVTHECEHVAQWWQGGFASMWLYVITDETRARVEAQAYAAGMEIAHALGVPVPPVSTLAQPLEGQDYLLSPAAKTLAHQILSARASQIVAGGVPATSRAARAGIDIIRNHWPHLLIPEVRNAV